MRVNYCSIWRWLMRDLPRSKLKGLALSSSVHMYSLILTSVNHMSQSEDFFFVSDFPPHHPRCSQDYWRYACLPHISIYLAPSKPRGQGQLSYISLGSAHTVDHESSSKLKVCLKRAGCVAFIVIYKIHRIDSSTHRFNLISPSPRRLF